MQGWYPDPGGAPGRYRYFDGTSWSAQTTTDPRQPPPGADGTEPARTRSRVPALLPLLVLALVLVAVGVLVLRGITGSRPEAASAPSPSSSTGVGDTSPTPSPSSGTGPDALADCPVGDPLHHVPHPRDGRVHGGSLSFRRVASFGAPAAEVRLSFATDVLQQTRPVNADPSWIAQLAVGRLPAAGGIAGDPRATAQRFVACSVNGPFYRPYGRIRTDVSSSRPVTVSGRQGWTIEVDVSVDGTGLPFPGDHAVFVVVPDGEDWGLFFGAVPMGNRSLTGTLDGVVRDLRAS